MANPDPRQIVVLDAPSNLGLRPPTQGAVPGVYKLAGAVRDQRLIARLGATDVGVVVPPRYQSEWDPGPGVRNEAAIARYSLRLADRLGRLIEDGFFPLVLGGTAASCSDTCSRYGGVGTMGSSSSMGTPIFGTLAMRSSWVLRPVKTSRL
jgi:arginase